MGRTTALGYGYHHQQARKRWKVVVDAGDVFCGRCGKWIDPATPWDLAHPDDDKTRTPVPWHRRCNRAYLLERRRQRPAAQPQNPKRRPGWRSPDGHVWSQDWGGGHWGDE